ncbi:MFS transporter [Actinotignum sp. GS-2025a]|uniref:MFS transporter n=1 Tax=Actinotignum sp. GS-2025a TaxID=3427274 RepID=UPI003F464DA0
MASGDNPFAIPDYRRWYLGTTFLELGSAMYIASSMLLVSFISSTKTVGAIVAVVETLAIIGSVLGGIISDVKDRRRVINICLAGAVVANAVICLAVVAFDHLITVGNALVCAVVGALAVEAILLGISGPARDGSLKSIIVPTAYPRAMSAAQARSSLFTVIGNPLSGVLFGLGRVIPFSVRLFCQGIFLWFFRKITADLSPKSHDSDVVDSKDPRCDVGKNRRFARLGLPTLIDGYRLSFKFLRSQPAMLRFIVCAPLVNLMVCLFMTWVVFYLRSREYSPAVVGLSVSGFALGSLLGSGLSPYLAKKIAPGWLAIIGLTSMTLTCVLFAVFGKAPGTIFMFAVLMMLPSPALNAGIFTYVFARTGNDMQGRVLASFQVVGGVSTIVGPVIAGYAASGNDTAFLLVGCAIAAVGVLLLITSRSVREIPKIQDI